MTEWRSYVERLFSRLGMRNPRAEFVKIPSDVFKDFCMGITYFVDEEPSERPVYNREASYLEKFTVHSSDTALQRRKKKLAIRTCYIERLMYDDIYEHILHEQNRSHIDELERMRELFCMHHPDETIRVVVTTYYKTIFPQAMLISSHFEDGTQVIETYRKPFGSESVYVEKHKIGGNARTAPMCKSQSFHTRGKWSHARF